MAHTEFVLRVSATEESDITRLWSDLCDKHNLESEHALADGITTQGFSGVDVVEWVIPMAEALTPIVTAVIGYLAANRSGEIEFSDGVKSYKFRKLTPEEAEKFLTLFGKHAKANEG